MEYNGQQPMYNVQSGEVVPGGKFAPLSPWAYFGYSLLFSIPIAGFILLIVFSFNDSNRNRRNFARSYWCGLIVAAIIFAIYLLLVLALGFSFASSNNLF